MDYNYFESARDLCWRILIDCNVDCLPIHVSDVCGRYSVFIRSYQQASNLIHLLALEEACRRNDGYSFLWNGEYWILYDASAPFCRVRFTIAHELGHCLMHHAGDSEVHPHQQIERCRDQGRLEQQANVFAADLLAPACILWGLNLETAEQITAHCNISPAAAAIRLKRLNQLRARDAAMQVTKGRGCFLSSPLERRVYSQFENYIIQNQINPQRGQAYLSDR
jgi:Zn-dependent peptidase ImmA (M78 family)